MVYEIKKGEVEFKAKEVETVEAGMITSRECFESDLIETFSTLEEAKEELKKYKSTAENMGMMNGRIILAKEYFIEENTYDEDGEWVDGGDILEFAELEYIERP